MISRTEVWKYFSMISSTFAVMFSMNACGTNNPKMIANPTPMTEPTQTIQPAPSVTPIPPTPTNTAIPTPTSPIPVSHAPDGLQMAYSIDGNLYLKDGSKPPSQLTHRREYRHPIGFSEDGQKIFFQGNFGILFSINVDGSDEQAVVTHELLRANSIND